MYMDSWQLVQKQRLAFDPRTHQVLCPTAAGSPGITSHKESYSPAIRAQIRTYASSQGACLRTHCTPDWQEGAQICLWNHTGL